MKKINRIFIKQGGFLFLSMLAIPATYAHPQYTQNSNSLRFYMGAQTGLLHSDFSASGDLVARPPGVGTISGHANGTSNAFGVRGELFFGLMCNLNRYVSFGGEINWGVNSGTGVSYYSPASVGSIYKYRVTQRIKDSYAISVLVGSHSVFHKNLLYARIGWVNGFFSSRADGGQGIYAGYDGSFNKWDGGVLVGVGLGSTITRHWAWRLETDYIGYGKFTKHSLPTSYFQYAKEKQIAKWTYKPRQLMFSVGLVYRF